MPSIDDAKAVADSYLDEIEATIEIRQSYTTVIVGMAGPLMGALSGDRTARDALQKALRHKSVDPSAFYKPLIVQVNGVFESYIRLLTQAVVETRFETASVYSDLDRDFRYDHIAHAARVLTHLKSGSIMGSAYNFDGLIVNLGKSLSGQKGFKLNPEIYTKLMGNCTADRLEKLFSAVRLPEPFSDRIGLNALMKAYFADRAKGRVAERAREELDRQLNLRNDIVHGDLTRTIDLSELRGTLAFFRALISSLDQIVRE